MYAATSSAVATGGWSAGGDNNIAAKIAQLLQSMLQSTSGATSDAAIIVTQLLNPTNGAAPMDVNLNQLLNNAVLQNALKQLPPELLAKPQIFEAVVLQNILLPNTPGKAATPNLPLLILPNPAAPMSSQPGTSPAGASQSQSQSQVANFYRVTVEWQNRVIQMISQQPLPTGQRVQLQTTPRGELMLVPNLKTALSHTTAPVGITPTPISPVQQAAQQALRELMPRQQPLVTLLPLLQKLVQPTLRDQLPAPIAQAVKQLLQSLPRAEQIQTPTGVKQAVENSGTFLESRLVRAANSNPNPSAQPMAQTPAAIATTDLKAQISTLLALVRTFIPTQPAQSATPTSPLSISAEELVYTHKPALQPQQGHIATGQQSIDSTESLLSQLSKLLQAGLARIQVNQLDGIVARHVGNDAQMPVPTWTMELPLRSAYGNEQLQLRIEQQPRKRNQQKRPQWNVQIALDLHELGKLAATLAIVDKNVAATLWAEREGTHRRVQEQIGYLRSGLESVGVHVTEMNCRLGMPPTPKNPLSQQLVDVHT